MLVGLASFSMHVYCRPRRHTCTHASTICMLTIDRSIEGHLCADREPYICLAKLAVLAAKGTIIEHIKIVLGRHACMWAFHPTHPVQHCQGQAGPAKLDLGAALPPCMWVGWGGVNLPKKLQDMHYITS